VARLLAARTEYHAVDIASGPVEMARQALRGEGQDPSAARQASALALPFEEETFDAVVAIGSLHHTGDLSLAVSEVHRVLRPGGVALVMVYNAHSLNRVVTAPLVSVLSRLVPSRSRWLRARTFRDANFEGAPAPHTDFITPREAKEMFAHFSSVHVHRENANPVTFNGHSLLPREWLLPIVGPTAGLDLYITAIR
jgi:ubiquinone/menaquinone biosynthesis C-methylase UbiE